MRNIKRQEGFTLIELLVGMGLAIVVLCATLTILDAYTHQSTINTQTNDAQNRARLGIDRIVWQLRNISSPITTPKLLERATPYDIVFQTVGAQRGSNTSGDERVRYCVPNDPTGTSTNEVLISETQTWTTSTVPPSPWSSDPSVTIPCPDAPPPTGVGTPFRLVNGITNRYQGRTDRPVFSYNDGALDNNLVAASDLNAVTSVQLDLFVNRIPTQTARESELRSSAFLRNQVHAPVARFTPTPTGGGTVLLNGGPSYSPDGYDLAYSWSCTTPGCPAASTLAASTDGLVSWSPGAGTYNIQLVVTDPSGLTGTYSQAVVVQ
jgi:type II secretory pathway pseudopilin PulG